jgi:signal transduction histidine kinase
VAVLFQDLTEIRKQESLERRRDRLAAVGELAAGIAHEIRNSVLPISGSVQILAQELPLDEEQARLFDLVSREMDSIERFVSDLLRYTRSQELHLENIDLAGLAGEMVEDWQLAGGKSVAISVEGDSTPALVDTDQIRQAIRNLIMNASDAVADGGRITVRTGTEKGRTAWVEVEDDGPGVAEDMRYRVFDPFYTSKPGGTGLGLAIVSRIVEDHEGRLELLDGAGGGARFRIVLNAARGDRADRPEAA